MSPDRLRPGGALLLSLLVVACAGDEPAGPPAAPWSGPAPVIEIPGRLSPFDGVLTGGQPTVEQLEEAAELGFRTIVNLRPEDEEGAIPDEGQRVAELEMRYVSIPLRGADDLTVENAEKLAAALEGPDALPALVHCASGNRVGALYGVKAFRLDGEGAEASLAIARAAGVTRLEPALRELLGLPPAEPDDQR